MMSTILLPRRPMVIAVNSAGKYTFIDPPKGYKGETMLVSLWKEVEDEHSNN